jgi:hypothetical protein
MDNKHVWHTLFHNSGKVLNEHGSKEIMCSKRIIMLIKDTTKKLKEGKI